METQYKSGLDLEARSQIPDEDTKNILQKVSDAYFEPKSFEMDGKLWEYLGVKYVQKAIMGTVGALFRKAGMDETGGNYFIGKKISLEALQKFEHQTRVNEIIHAPQIIWNGIMMSDAIASGHYGSAGFWGALFLLNTGCTMLQRYNRARVCKAIDRIQERRIAK